MSSALADIFHKAAELNVSDPRRGDNVVSLPAGSEVIACGDIHGHRANLNRIIAYADLPARPERQLVLQEIVHGPPDQRTGHDRSVDVLLRAARLKIAQPGQVTFLLGNHDIAQASGNEITKAGRGVCESFILGVRFAVGPDAADEVLEAVKAFLLSLPLAARCPGGTLLCHTLPTPQRMALAGEDIPAGAYTPESIHRGGPVYEWTWGRKQTPEQIDRLAEHLGVSYFVLAHQHIPTGHEVLSPRAILLTSEHDRGAILQFSADTALTEQTALAALKPIAALAAGS